MNIDALLDDAIALARADRDATTMNKASSASTAPVATGQEKLSSVRERNEDFARLGVLVANLGEHSFQKMAMESMESAQTTTLASPKETSGVSAEIRANNTAAPSSSAGGVTQPTTFTSMPGATGGPDFTPSAASPTTGGKDLATKGVEGAAFAEGTKQSNMFAGFRLSDVGDAIRREFTNPSEAELDARSRRVAREARERRAFYEAQRRKEKAQDAVDMRRGELAGQKIDKATRRASLGPVYGDGPQTIDASTLMSNQRAPKPVEALMTTPESALEDMINLGPVYPQSVDTETMSRLPRAGSSARILPDLGGMLAQARQYSEPLIMRRAGGGGGGILPDLAGESQAAARARFPSVNDGILPNLSGAAFDEAARQFPLMGSGGSSDPMRNVSHRSGHRSLDRDKLSHFMGKVSGGLYLSPDDARTVLNHYGMSGPEDVVAFLKNSSDVRGQRLADFLIGAELHDADKVALFAERAKRSMGEPTYHSQLATAKEAVEAGVQATGALPTTQDIVRTTGVDPAVANTAQMQVAQTIVAAGGSVAAPGGVEAAPVDGAGTAMAAPAAAAAPAAPAVVPAPGAPAPVDPSMAATTDPNAGAVAPMAAPAKTASARVEDPVAALKSLLDTYETKVSEGPTMDREEATTGPASPRETAVTGGDAPEGSGRYEMSASERAVADALSSNQSAADVTAADTDAMKAGDITGRVNTPVSAPSTEADMTTPADEISGTMEGVLADGTGDTEKESDDFVSRIRQVAADSLRKASSSVMVATGGRGSNEVVGGSQVFTGGPSDSMSGSVKKAYKYARQIIEKEGVPPEVTDVMKATGVQLDDAKTGIYHASNG